MQTLANNLVADKELQNELAINYGASFQIREQSIIVTCPSENRSALYIVFDELLKRHAGYVKNTRKISCFTDTYIDQIKQAFITDTKVVK